MLTRIYRLIKDVRSFEECYYLESSEPIPSDKLYIVGRLIGDPGDSLSDVPHIAPTHEIGPRLAIETAFSSNGVNMFRSLSLPITRVERSRRYVNKEAAPELDPLLEQVYAEPLTTFESGLAPDPVRIVPILEEGRIALERVNRDLGLGMDAADLDYYTATFTDRKRNPTDVELFQIGNGNSEHSRHHFWTGIQHIDGNDMPLSLMDIVKAPWKANPGNRLTAFHDNSGVMRGRAVIAFKPERADGPSSYIIENAHQHYTATAETHNHPTMIAPFPGAETGAGGRIRDNRAVGRGGLTHAGAAGYAVGTLHIPGHDIPGETIGGEIVATHAAPLDILIKGSNGVSDYGNKIGEPLITGFTRSFGQMVNGERREFRKPILYTAGIGRIYDEHVLKLAPSVGMYIIRIGGRAYPIGLGGGSASSMIQGQNAAHLDLKSVQRGDAEMENRVNRVIQSCAEMRDRNPILSIHDQGAGGPSNVLTELMEPAGGRIDIRKINTGDSTMSVLQLWGSEFQEGYGLLLNAKDLELFQAICARERVNCEVLGEITGDTSVVVYDSRDDSTPVNLALEDILAKVPRKRFPSVRVSLALEPFITPSLEEYRFRTLVYQVFRQLSVGSKGFLVRKVDRSVTGRVAQQQCVGPMQIPVADAGVTADGFFECTGVAQALGENSNRMLASSESGARMAVAEMLTNLVSAGITRLSDVSCRANWMWAAKLPHEGARLYDAAVAMSKFMIELGITIDGGKDSLSMATSVNGTQVVSPGQLVIYGYAPVPDITRTATPDFTGSGKIGFIDLGKGMNRLGGSALAQSFGLVGNDVPDIDNADYFKRAFMAMNELVWRGLITAYHDRSDGGLIAAIAEMCMAGNCGAIVSVPGKADPVATWFNEEAGMVFEYSGVTDEVATVLATHEVTFHDIGFTSRTSRNLTVHHDGSLLLETPIIELRSWWEETSSALELQQSNHDTIKQEVESFSEEDVVEYRYDGVVAPAVHPEHRHKFAIIREEGTNGECEMAAACFTGGLEPKNIAMEDILSGKVDNFDQFRGMIFPGGFSYADVFGSAKGWAAPMLFNDRVRDLFARFYAREDTVSLGVCNGCQLMAHTGRVPYAGISYEKQPRFVHNESGRFESRWSAVKILPSPTIHFKGMEGSILGVHVAHGEGRLHIPELALEEEIRERKLAPLAFVSPSGRQTERYPYNPNGSPNGWAGLCTPNGRHLAMMPHPERAFKSWQWHWMPEEFRKRFPGVSPWLQMFHNMRIWCDQN